MCIYSKASVSSMVKAIAKAGHMRRGINLYGQGNAKAAHTWEPTF